MDRLQGGPYYELSFLIRNQVDKESLVENILSNLNQKTKFNILNPKEDLHRKIRFFVAGEEGGGKFFRSFDIDTLIEISGNRKSRLFICELSDELLKINFWFYGSQYDAIEWNQIGLKESDKPEFRKFFWQAKGILDPILGTIAYEEDCSELFESAHNWPNDCYKVENLSIKTIKERLHRNKNEFEFCWIKGSQFNLDEDIEIEIKIA